MGNIMNRTHDLLCIGDAIVDITVKANFTLLETLQLTKSAMTPVDEDTSNRLYQYLKSEEMNGQISTFIERPGGSAANTAAGFAGLGGRAAYVGKVSDDVFGELFVHKMNEEKIFYNTALEFEVSTGRSIIIVTPDGARTMSTFGGSSAELHEADIDDSLIAQSSTVFFTAFSWDSENLKKAIYKAIDFCQQYGTKIALTLSDSYCVERHREMIMNLIEHDALHYIFGNIQEVNALCQCDDFNESVKKMQLLCQKHPLTAALTCSKDGALVLGRDEAYKIPTVPVETPVDKTGVGSLFASGFLYGMNRQFGLKNSGMLANECAAEGLSQLGARVEKDLRVLLKKYQTTAA